jgi:deoxyribonucleoside regulator
MINSELTSLMSLTAKLYYLDGLGQIEIAEIIGISRSKVSRLLTRARETGIVSVTISNYSPRNHVLEHELKQCFQMNQAIVVKTFAEGDIASIRHTTGYIAAPVISELIRHHTVIGIAGGRTLHQLVRYLQPVGEIAGITVAQLMGNIGPQVGQIDAIELGRVLSQKFRGSFYAISAPAFALDLTTRDVFLEHEQVRTVWDLYEKMDIALVGIGTLKNSAFIERNVIDQSELESLQNQGVIGEICGRFYDAQGQECDTSYRERVISLGLEKLCHIPEVVGVTHGADRADAACAALRGRLIHSLVIDEDGATAVLAAANRGSNYDRTGEHSPWL